MIEGWRLDLHVHSRHSPDGRASVDELVARLPYTGLRGFALTDHNSISGHADLARAAAAHPTYRLLPGVEVSSREGHVLALGVSECPPPHRPLADTIDWIGAHGGVAVLAHPLRRTHGVGARWAEEARVPVIETRNAHNGEVANARAELIAARRGLGGSGGSDAHLVTELGLAYTQFPDGAREIPELLDALRRGRTQGAGRSLRWTGRLRWAAVTGARFLGRGFRSV